MTKTHKGLFKVIAVVITLLLVVGLTTMICFAADGASGEGITKVSISLDETIAVNIRTTATTSDGSKLVLTLAGKEYTLSNNASGIFTFTGVTPQHFNSTITATLYSKDGNKIGESEKFSIRSYLEALLDLTYEESGCSSKLQYTAMKELAVNMLNYGAAAQVYTNTNASDLANKNLSDEEKALATAPITVSGSDKAVNGSAWVGAGVRFDYRLGLYFVFTADSLDGVTASVNGQTVTPNVYDESKNQYVLRYANFTATNMNDVITAKLVIDGVEQTYAYSIKSYVAAKGGDGSALAKLVGATYAYGYAAVAYSSELKAVDPTLETAGYVGLDSKGYDFSGSAYERIVLPALNTVDYTLTTTSTAGAKPTVETVYTFKSDMISYSTSVYHNDCIRVNDTYYTSGDISLLNSADVEVTYDETKGYTYNAKSAQSLTFIAAYGADLTLVGDITIIRDANNWSHYNTLNIGSETATCNLTVDTANSSNWGIRLEGGADMYIAEGSTMTVTAGKPTYSVFSAAQGSTIVVDGALTAAAKIRLENAALLSDTYEYGFLPALYVRRGTVTIQNGQLLTNSLQVGSERDGYSGTLKITQTAKGTNYGTSASSQKLENTINYENGSGALRYVFAKGVVDLTDASSDKLTAIDVRNGSTSYVDFKSGITVKTTGAYSHLLGGWSFAGDYRWSAHTDAKFNLSVTGALLNMGKASKYHLTFYSDADLTIDNVPAKYWIASYTYTEATHTTPLSALVANGDGTSSFADISFADGKYTTVANSAVTLGLAGKFDKATSGDSTIYYQIIGTHTHTLTKVEGKDSTCKETGVEAYYICDCEKMFSDEAGTNEITDPVVIPVKPHTEVVDAAVAPTCTNTGLTAGKHCSACGTVTVPQNIEVALGHLDANNDYTCDRTECGAKLCTNHNVVIDEGVKETCTTDGLTEGKHCSICGEIIEAQTVISAPGHNEVIDNAVEATCTTDGLTEGKHCSNCNEVFLTQVTVPALNHKNATFVALVDATIDSEGNIAHYACPDCGCYALDDAFATKITSPILPKLGLENYTTSTLRPSYATTVSVDTLFTLISDEIEYSVAVTTDSFLTLNRGEGEIIVTKFDYTKLNTDIVTVTYDDKTGYTYTVAEGHTETGITGQGIRSAGRNLTIIGNVEINVSTRWGQNNNLIIGTSEKPANVIVVCTGTSESTKHGLAMWDGADLTVNEGSLLKVTSSAGDSINCNGTGSVYTFAGKVITNGNISGPSKDTITATGDVYVGKGWYKKSGSITVDGKLETGTYINFVDSGTFTINGTVIVNTVLTVNGAASANSAYEYGFKPNVYVAGSLSVLGGVFTTNSLQLGSEANNVSGTLILCNPASKDAKNVGVVSGKQARIALGQGEIKLQNTYAGMCAFDVRNTNTSYVHIGAGVTIKTTVNYGSIVGEWTTGTYHLYVDLGFDFAEGSVNNFFAIKEGTKHFYFHNTKTVNIDGVEKQVTIGSYAKWTDTSNGYYTLSRLAGLNAVEEGAAYTSTTTTATYGNLGIFTKATTADGKEIYYQEIN